MSINFISFFMCLFTDFQHKLTVTTDPAFDVRDLRSPLSPEDSPPKSPMPRGLRVIACKLIDEQLFNCEGTFEGNYTWDCDKAI